MSKEAIFYEDLMFDEVPIATDFYWAHFHEEVSFFDFSVSKLVVGFFLPIFIFIADSFIRSWYWTENFTYNFD